MYKCICVCVCVCIVVVIQNQVMADCLQPHGIQHARLLFTMSWSSLKLMSVESVMPANDHILCHPLLLLPSIFPSIRVFSSESALHIRWPKYWSFNFSISPSKEYSGLISFRIDWFDIFAVQMIWEHSNTMFQEHREHSKHCYQV